jgi:hypothetical protein
MAVTKIKPVKSTLAKALDYIKNPDKTDGKLLVSSFACSYETADMSSSSRCQKRSTKATTSRII